ncbi:MAG: chemoreceptor glutamine deamidase CheD [candidate division Zixibacteria bacterium]|nr:chemoreceptor glutamine deamidase CheD [Gammaproteobacteria bacterium]NIR48471.1 chemoreceptor glutamine deamidase CheD [candidate division KSB1 bacterium]NIR63829.1 chemoreceptor glutamine deamidase CheD [candidate division Zixibacteria bacterium]NIS45791.1 chemoreceptor glutamine deamidase CheD [candidate division Zixibacteria bacterium]NIT70946.1 chemoreceptor glutamine deamidase CheD [candidate division KSB1 bacterium]
MAPPDCLPGFENIKRYWDKKDNHFIAKILPGEYYVTRYNEGIVTVLGSCISACIRDPISGVGGMNHFMLPSTESENSSKGSWTQSARFGNFAMELLINEILKNGGKRDHLEVKVFGGGKIIQNMTDVGNRNIDFVIDYLNKEGLVILSQDVGDVFPRKVYYNPKNGVARVKRLQSLHDLSIVERESEYMKNINEKPKSGDIDLF